MNTYLGRGARVQQLAAAVLSSGLLLLAFSASAQQSAASYKTSYRYNSLGQQTGLILADPDGSGPLRHLATRNTYDNRGLLELIEEGWLAAYQSDTVAPENWSGFTAHRKLVFTYDDLGRRLTEAVADGNGNKQTLIHFSYDGENRVVCSTERMNPSEFDNLPASACSLGAEGVFGPDRITRYTYGAAGYGEVTKEERAVGTPLQQDHIIIAYDSYYRVAGITDANGNYTHQTYDSTGRVSHLYFPSKSVTGVHNSLDYEEYRYDNNGNRTALRKRDGRWIYYTYDALNRATRKNVPGTTDDVYYGYDLRGKQLYARFASSSGQGVTNTFDGFGNLATARLNMAGITRTLTYRYDHNNNRTRVTHPDGKYFTYTYDDLNRAKDIYEYTSTLVASYVHENRGRLSNLNRLSGAGTSYGYDAISRPDSLSHNLYGSGDDVSYDFGHNPASQIVSRTTSNDDYVYAEHAIGAESYSVNGLNQYTSIGGATLTYDPNGNLTSDGSVTYSYDIENRLRSVSGGKNATLKYDPLGRLFETVGDGVTTRFLYDGDSLVAELNGSGAVVYRYVHGPGIDKPIVEYAGSAIGSSARRNLYSDHLGSIVARTNYYGSVINVNHYDSYGIPDSLNSGRFAYTGQIWIPEIDLYHYKARLYSPTLGRFLQTDPVGYQDQVNLYAYVGNDPFNNTDPTGELAWFIPVVACLANSGCRGAVTAAFGAAVGAVTANEGERLRGAGKGAITGFVGGSTLNPKATVGTAVALGVLDGALDGATDGDPETSPVGSGLGQGVADGVSALGGVGAASLAKDELGDVLLGAGGSLATGAVVDGQDAKDAGNAITNHLSEAPLYPNANETTLPPRNAPKPEDFLRCNRDPNDFNRCQ